MNIRTVLRRSLPAALAAAFAFGAAFANVVPALARDSYVQDGAAIFKPSTISTLNSTISELQRATGKEIVVVTVPSLNGQTPRTAVENAFSQQQVNGVLFYFAKEEKKDYVVGDNASRSIFRNGTFEDVHNAMRGYLRSGDPDTAVTTGVNLVADQYRSHLRNGVRSGMTQPSDQHTSQGGFGMGFIILLLVLLAGFLIIRAIFRAMAGPRMMPPGYGGPGFGGGPGYGGPGYGGMGGMGGGGGGSFFSGLLGGLGGAFIGNELFGGRRDEFGGGQNAGFGNGNDNGGYDNSGFQSDPGQADMGGMGGGDWGGGGDSGGGGGDGGGGW